MKGELKWELFVDYDNVPLAESCVVVCLKSVRRCPYVVNFCFAHSGDNKALTGAIFVCHAMDFRIANLSWYISACRWMWWRHQISYDDFECQWNIDILSEGILKRVQDAILIWPVNDFVSSSIGIHPNTSFRNVRPVCIRQTSMDRYLYYSILWRKSQFKL